VGRHGSFLLFVTLFALYAFVVLRLLAKL